MNGPPSKSAPAPPGAAASPQEYARAKYDYASTEAGELGFKIGQRIKVTQKSDDGAWWRGVLDSGDQGWFPSSYVVEDDSTAGGQAPATPKRPGLPAASTTVASPGVGSATMGAVGGGFDSFSDGGHSNYSSGASSAGPSDGGDDYFSLKLRSFYEQHNPRKLEDPNFIREFKNQFALGCW